jgi:glycogen operon protein
VSAGGAKDVTWLRPDGAEMTADDWHAFGGRTLAMLMHGEASDEIDDRGRPVAGDTLLLLLNADDAPCTFVLPTMGTWRELVDTSRPGRRVTRSGSCRLPRYGLTLLRLVPQAAAGGEKPVTSSPPAAGA